MGDRYPYSPRVKPEGALIRKIKRKQIFFAAFKDFQKLIQRMSRFHELSHVQWRNIFFTIYLNTW